MDALAGAEIDKLPFFFTTLYEKEALKLKEGQSEDWLDDDLRSSALAQGLCDIDLELPNAPDVLGAAASPLRRSADDQGLRSPPKHSYSSIHRLGDVTGRITYKHPRVKEDSVTDFDAESALLPEHSRASSPDSVTSHHPHVSATMTASQRAALNLALENAQFRDLWQEYSKIWERVLTFEVKQKLLLQFWEKFSRRSLYGQFMLLKDRLAAKHSQESERLDEKQLKAEYALEQAHREERARSAAALKHMKAYCSGSSVPGSTKRRIVTEDDKRRLREQEKLHDELDSKHEAAMKMTRARQEKDVKELKHEHEQEIKELDKKYKEARILSRRTTQEVSHQLDDVIRGRRLRVVRRWYINLKLWDRTTTDHDDVPAYADLPIVSWPDKTVVETMTSRTYSVLDTWHTFNDLPPAVSLHVPGVPESD
ncbi:hypothetical protein SLS58_002110 [Diplodia intermedia]|uniref:Uncharacterized protein n=1 Tax=Diplodia intermedia TaxID=856260 RepID=A0ABR3U028_9PEZI